MQKSKCKIKYQNSKIKKIYSQLTTNNLPLISGFTLIEILVTISVIFILLSISIVSYGQFNEKQKLISSGQSIKNLIRDAQNRAYNGELDCTVCNCDASSGQTSSFNGWYVNFISKSIYGDCNNIQFSVQPSKFPPQVTIVPHLTPPDKILFRYQPPSVDQNGIICLSQRNYSSSYKIIINSSGDISDNGLVDVCP